MTFGGGGGRGGIPGIMGGNMFGGGGTDGIIGIRAGPLFVFTWEISFSKLKEKHDETFRSEEFIYRESSASKLFIDMLETKAEGSLAQPTIQI